LRVVPNDDSSERAAQPADRTAWSSLMARAQDGDQEAYRQLLHETAGYLRSLVARHHRNPADVEDTVQDILLTVHAIRHTYDPNRPFGPWLVAIAHRRIVDRLRRQGRARARETPLDPTHETFAAAEANLPEMAGDDRALREAINRLPEGQRQAITLLKLNEMSLKEAAAASGISIAALKVASHRAIKKLRSILGDRRGSDHDT
jgi:RNA polymerase sigma-70 factor, ECF subfamily